MNTLRKLFRKFKESPLSFPYFVFAKIICRIRSIYYSRKIDEGGGKIIITKPFIKFEFQKHKSAHLFIEGQLLITNQVEGSYPTVLFMSANSKFEIYGNLKIGRGVRFNLLENSVLTIGRKRESDSGITADTLITVFKKITIGNDFVCAWNVFISDSDLHQIKGQNHHGDINIGDHVWIANCNNILKGSTIGSNCILASNSKINNKSFPDNVLIGGIPPQILKVDIEWSVYI